MDFIVILLVFKAIKSLANEIMSILFVQNFEESEEYIYAWVFYTEQFQKKNIYLIGDSTQWPTEDRPWIHTTIWASPSENSEPSICKLLAFYFDDERITRIS